MRELEKETKFIMQKYNIKANKNLGQNFLINENIIEYMIKGSNIESKDMVIEIGPGLGTLTKFLLETAKKVIAIEIDEKMVKILKERFYEYSSLEIFQEDVLNMDLKHLIQQKLKEFPEIKNIKVIANLPYYITTPIIMKLIEEKLPFESITVMVQKEVAERLIATPGEKISGAITYTVNYYYKGKKIIEVPNDSFIPSPEVTSEIIKLEKRNKKPVRIKQEKIFFDIIKKAFMQRRKTLLNALVNGNIFRDKEQGIKILNELNIDENIRAEKLTMQNFADIANKIIEDK